MNAYLTARRKTRHITSFGECLNILDTIVWGMRPVRYTMVGKDRASDWHIPCPAMRTAALPPGRAGIRALRETVAALPPAGARQLAWAAEQVALGEFHPEAGHQLRLGLCFHHFGDHAGVHGAGQIAH